MMPQHNRLGATADIRKSYPSMKATDGSKALRFKYDFSNGGWYDVAKYLDGANWSGESVLAFQVKGDGSDNAIGLQIGTSDGKYFLQRQT